ncbi:MAG: branched-chain amino acid ABC transporter permease [Egibacteraceae bacterium]
MNFEALADCLTTASCFVPRLLGGLASAAVIYLVASGLSLVFGVMGVLNFAHGSLYMLGAYLGYTVADVIAGGTGNLALVGALVIAPLLVALFGGVMEVSFLRRIYGRELLYQLLLTFAFILLVNGLVHEVYGAQFITSPVPRALTGTVMVLGRPFPLYQLFLIVVAIVVGVALTLFIQRSRHGMILRATAEDPEMSRALGVNVPAVWTIVFMAGAALGGLGGSLAGPLRSLFPGMDLDVVVQAFLVVVIGGLGSLAGAAAGAVLVGLFRAFGVIVAPGLELVFIYILVIIILIARPRGLAGREVAH